MSQQEPDIKAHAEEFIFSTKADGRQIEKKFRFTKDGIQCEENGTFDGQPTHSADALDAIAELMKHAVLAYRQAYNHTKHGQKTD